MILPNLTTNTPEDTSKPRITPLQTWLLGRTLRENHSHSSPSLQTGLSVVRGKHELSNFLILLSSYQLINLSTYQLLLSFSFRHSAFSIQHSCSFVFTRGFFYLFFFCHFKFIIHPLTSKSHGASFSAISHSLIAFSLLFWQ